MTIGWRDLDPTLQFIAFGTVVAAVSALLLSVIAIVRV